VAGENTTNCPDAVGLGWTLVRRTSGNSHPAADSLEGTAVYGTASADPLSEGDFSVNFDQTVPGWNEFLLTTGDCRHWMVMEKDAAIGFYGSNIHRQVLRSHVQNEAYMVRVLRRTTKMEDPWIQYEENHNQATALYVENSYNANSGDGEGAKYSGLNVYVRNVPAKVVWSKGQNYYIKAYMKAGEGEDGFELQMQKVEAEEGESTEVATQEEADGEGRGAVFTRWGSRTCPEGSTKLFGGFMVSSHHGHNGGGANTLCFHDQPEYPWAYDDGNQDGNLLYGMEYENTGAIDKNSNKDAACVVCEHSSALDVYTQWGRTTCSNGHATLYSGLVMSNKYTQTKGESVCVDVERAPHAMSYAGDENGGLLYTSEMETGASDEHLYPGNREVACAVCAPGEGEYTEIPLSLIEAPESASEESGAMRAACVGRGSVWRCVGMC